MNKWFQKTLAVAVSLAVCVCSGGMSSARHVALAGAQKSETAQTEARTVRASGGEETVYVLVGADGAVRKVLVSEDGSLPVDETEELRGGADKLPIGMTVSYTLDGKNVTAQELAGKSGRVTIRFDYENRAYETVKIGEKNEKIYVPFALLTGLLLDNDTFSNVEVSNGRVVNDGDHTIVVALALPGLRENLALSADALDIPDYVEITADAENFALGMTVTIATNELFSELDDTKLDSADDASATLGELTDAMAQLMDGADALHEGLVTLSDKTGELVSGVDQIASGALQLKTGAASLNNGAAELKAGASELAAGLATLSENSAGLNSGAEQVFNTLLSAANTQLAAAGLSVSTLTVGNYADVLTGVIASLDSSAVYEQALSQVTAAVEAERDTIAAAVAEAVRAQVQSSVEAAVRAQVSAAVTETVREQVVEAVLAESGLESKADYDAAVEAGLVDADTQAAIDAAVEGQMASEAVQSQISENVTAQMQSESIQSTITQNVETQMASEDIQSAISQNTEAQVQQAIADNMASDAVQSQLAAASEGAQSVIALKTSLDSYNAFYLGLASYTAGVDQAASGASALVSGAGELKDGAEALSSGASSLSGGAAEMQDSMPALTEGVTELTDGAQELADGLAEFNEQVIEKLVQLVEDDLDGLVEHLRATIDVSRGYEGLASDAGSTVKFIYRTDEITAE